MKINGVESEVVLTALLESLYKKMAHRDGPFILPIRVIDAPDVVKSILMSPDLFIKNYGFLENISKGRFSANGPEWSVRAAITQSFYSQATNILNDDLLENVYSKHLQAFAENKAGSLYETFVAAALEVVSRAFHLNNPIPWPSALVNRARSCLIDQQAMAWTAIQPESYIQSQRELAEIYSEFEHLWSQDPDLVSLFKQFTDQADGIDRFSAVGEMLQNLFASTETTASSLLWILECITRHIDRQALLVDDDLELDYFIDESLRLFPPVPFITRVCAKQTQINGLTFAENESIVISIVGVHSDPTFWEDPLTFKIRRREFVDSSYSRHAYIPFLSGPRSCAGMKLAKQEVKCGVRALLKQFKVESCNEPRKLSYGISSRPGIELERYLSLRIVTRDL